MDLSALPVAAAGAQGVGALGAIMIGCVCMAVHRGYGLFDRIVDVVEDQTVKVVEVVGVNITMAVPILMGLCLTMLIVLVKREVSRSYAIDLKIKALMEGQNLEGNAALEGQPAASTIRKSSRVPSPAAVLVELGNLQPKASGPACKNFCSYWATVCRPDFEWIGACCEFRCTKIKGHP